MRIASVDVCLDPGYLVLICTHIIINYLSINVILSLDRTNNRGDSMEEAGQEAMEGDGASISEEGME